VLRQGVIVEAGPAEQVIGAPRHAYTRDLMAAAFAFDADRLPLS
jgi:peptide/nickel transport system ATP-binding protein